MSTKLRGFLVLCGILFGGILFAQEKTVTGTVTDSNGFPLEDVVVTTSSGQEVYTDIDGNFSIVASRNEILRFESIGLDVVTAVVGTVDIYDVVLKESSTFELEGGVITALGITREKKSLGYATQEVSGETLSAVPVTNFADALSGEVSGLDINQSGTMGGSTNMIVRGYSSLYGSNQALIVIDGTPINNDVHNATNQASGGGGYDYGNPASDINPNDIENVNVLKGAAATALYGSRGANGVIMITTKKGKRQRGIGVEINSSIMVGSADKETLPKYQNKYGSGYAGDGTSFYSGDINGDGVIDNNIVYTYDDASFGTAFDPNLMVYNWDSMYPQLPTYLQQTPWVAGASTPNDIWDMSTTYVNSASFNGGNENGGFRLGYTNYLLDGNLDNSNIKRNTIDFTADYKLTDKLKAFAGITYTNTKGKGRVGTGYEGRNPMQTFRQWWNLSVDMQKQKEAYMLTGQNITWNTKDWENLEVGYSDNYYFNRYENYQNDERNRYFGNVGLNYELTDWLNVLGRFTFDNYSEFREERVAVGSAGGQGWIDAGGAGEYYYMRQNVSEVNYDVILNARKDITENINIDANLGWNLRVNERVGNSAVTNGGLKIPGLYSITNTAQPLTEENLTQFDINKKVDGLYANASVGFYNMLFLDGSIRTDRSSALPIENNRYWYPAGSISFLFSEVIDARWLNFGKVRANYAQVGNDTDAYQLINTYVFNPGFNNAYMSTSESISKNPNLKAETMEEFEVGLEMAFLKNRISFDVSYYNRKTFDLITPVDISSGSGNSALWQNSGDVVNKGVEARLTLVPIRSENFTWEMTANFAKNDNEVTRIAGDTQFLELASAWNIQVGATLGEDFGTIRGTNFVFNENGEKIIGDDGYYLVSDQNEVIGNMNPDWTGGLRNTFSYKNLSLSFLIDVQQGGDIFSFDTSYGYATGLYDFTAGTNDLGNPVRNSLANGGGIILPGVIQTDVDLNGNPIYGQNDIRVDASNFLNPWGYALGGPEASHIYDASFVKLRNVTLSYDLPEKLIQNTFIKKFTISAIGRNLWIIHKNIPYSDPEAGLSAGNIQGIQNGAHPTIREIGASIKVEF
ncbi:MAG: SusC/RagA family TonB-linked outer membrane protein [Moheibacter sp.]